MNNTTFPINNNTITSSILISKACNLVFVTFGLAAFYIRYNRLFIYIDYLFLLIFNYLNI